MLEKVSQLAEQVATRMSRRSLLGKIGQGALAVAAALGILVLPKVASAAGGGKRCCWYYHATINAYTTQCVNVREACPGYPSYQQIVQGCRQCRSDTF